MAYVRPGGVAQDVPDDGDRQDPRVPRLHAEEAQGVRGPALRPADLAAAHPGRRRARRHRLPGAGRHRPGAALAPAWPGTCARPMPYCGYETYEFDVPTATDRRRLGPLPGPAGRDARVAEASSSRRWTGSSPGPVMVADKKIAWPAQLALGVDGLGNSLEHVAKIMGQSMESLIHHFKLVTEGFRVPPGQVYVADRGARAASSACTRSPTAAPGPYRVHCREPELRQPAGHPGDGRGRPDRRRDRRRRLAGPRDGWV